MTAPSVAAVVVNYNAGRHLIECVRSLREDGLEEIVVVDNASTDSSVRDLEGADPSVTLIRSPRNRGFGGGVNLGVASLTEQFVLEVNPDAVIEVGTVKALLAAFEGDPRLAAVGPRVENPDRTLYPSARTFPGLVDSLGHAFLGLVWRSNPWSRRYLMVGQHDHYQPVDWISGACMMLRRAAFEEVGGFDEGYFMYSEEVDLCWRLREKGWRVAYEPAACVVHAVGVSTAHHPYRMIVAHHRSLLRFASRTTQGPRRLLLPIVALGLASRAVFVAIRRALGRSTVH